MQSEVARAIAGQIRLRLTRQTEHRLSNTPRVNALAHDAYLQGQQAWDLRDKEGTARSIKQFQHAIEMDPNYAGAYAALARAYALSPVSGLIAASEAMPKAQDAAARAIALDDSLAAGHSVLGFIKAHYEYDWPAAEQEFQRALRLNPSDSLAHLFYSNSYLSPLGRHDEAIAEMKTAIALDPFSLRIQSFLGRTYIWARRYDDALAQFQKTTQMFPNLAIEHERLAHLYTYRASTAKLSPKRAGRESSQAKTRAVSCDWRSRCALRSQPVDREAIGKSYWNSPREATIRRKLIRHTMGLRSYMFGLEKRRKPCKRWSRLTTSGSYT